MQSLRKCVQGLASACASSVLRQPPNVLPRALNPAAAVHNTLICRAKSTKPFHFLSFNDKMYPVQTPDEERRPAYVCHQKVDVKYSPKKMWYIACLVRGMSVDEAVKQLSFLNKKGAEIAKQTILEAQKLAVERHNVEFKSNLWVAESFSTKGHIIKGIRRHARMRAGEIRYNYIHYFVRLEEGKPPENYYLPVPKNKDEHLAAWMKQMRSRKIVNSL